ncbi:hypothetical protein NQ314_020925 [Rhamnusium bicolor]|uniref:Chitin-binding type-4 domain-containing protein n=1 Tax=Rhamnusium bicolor TaxID=1586634 RepID=A0AAV8WKQ5_9CUCU|nr:hypothetical protein NQ314_020925 [Rhamnusium bicolor]
MSKKVCVCGTEHETEQPIVITITACQNKCHEKDKTKSTENLIPLSTSSPMSLAKYKQKSIDTMTNDANKDDEIIIDHLLYCEEEEVENVPPPSKSSPIKAVDRCTGCDLDDTDEKEVEDMFRDLKKSQKTDQSVHLAVEKKRRNQSCDTSTPVPHIKSSINLNVSNNFPSDTAIKLPILIPRYHGPGCAMEVNVLEKHDNHCSYKKMKNPERNPTDDRTGSYEVIGRLVFKTCQQGTNMPLDEASKTTKSKIGPQSSKLAAIYSLFNISSGGFDGAPGDAHLCSSTSAKEIQALQRYLKRKRVFESLAKSSKSFPTNLGQCSAAYDTKRSSERGETSQCRSLTSYEVEELYFFEQKSNKSIQISESYENKPLAVAMNSVLIFVFIGLLAKDAVGHGMMLDPPNRSSLWRFVPQALKDYDDNANFCGGANHGLNGGKCGVCGDSYTDPHPQDNENTGKYGTGIVTAKYESGSVIDVSVRLTSNHLGTFTYSVCVLEDPNAPEPGEHCFIPISLEDGSSKYKVSKDEIDIVNESTTS